jgi:hypothetical protein
MTNNGKGKEQRHMITKHRPQRNGDGGNRDERQHRFCFGENNKIQLRKPQSDTREIERTNQPRREKLQRQERGCCPVVGVDGGRWRKQEENIN